MSTLPHALPYGLRDVRLTPNVNGVLGTGVDLPVARTFSFSETEDFEELRGDDQVAATHGAGPLVEWSLESGGLPFEAFQVMAGGTLISSGTSPAQKKVFSKLTTDARPYFDAEGQAISDSGGDVHGYVHRCKADSSLEGELGNGAFFLLSASGKGYGDTVGDNPSSELYNWTQNETAIAIT
jgi:hypothetical protein